MYEDLVRDIIKKLDELRSKSQKNNHYDLYTVTQHLCNSDLGRVVSEAQKVDRRS